MTTLKLTGLKGHHPLGFLAACGTAVACAEAREGVRLGWTRPIEEGPWIAQIQFHTHGNPFDELLSILMTRARNQNSSPALGWPDGQKKTDRKINKQQPARFREYAKKALAQEDISLARIQSNAFAALTTDAIITRDHMLQPTYFDMTSASQGFVDQIKDLAKNLAKVPSGQSTKPTPQCSFQEALIGPWQYRDDEHSLGWDPQAQRLHALRNKAPTNDAQGLSVRAAVFLASQALPLFPCFAVAGKLRTTGFYREKGEDWFSWPIWRDPISLDTLRSLLAHPFSNDLRRRGVEVVYRCRRVRTGGSEGNYQVFSHPELRAWPLTRRSISARQR